MKFPVPWRRKRTLSKGHGIAFRVEQLATAVPGRVVDEYDVGQAHIVISDEGGKGHYIIMEPALTDEEEQVYSLLMESLYYSLKPVIGAEDPIKYVETFIWEAGEELGLIDRIKATYPKYKYFITRDSLGYAQIDAMIRDQNAEEISCEGYGKPVAVLHRKYSEFDWLDSNVSFETEEAMKKFIQKMSRSRRQSKCP